MKYFNNTGSGGNYMQLEEELNSNSQSDMEAALSEDSEKSVTAVDISQLILELKALKEDNQLLKSEFESFKEILDTKDKLQEESRKLEQKSRFLKLQQDKTRESIDRESKENEERWKELEARYQARLESKTKGLYDEIAYLTSEREELEKEVRDLRAKRNNYDSILKDYELLKEDYSKIKLENSTIKETQEVFERKKDTISKLEEFDSLSSRHKRLQEEYAKLQAETDAYKSQIRNLEGKVKALEGENRILDQRYAMYISRLRQIEEREKQNGKGSLSISEDIKNIINEEKAVMKNQKHFRQISDKEFFEHLKKYIGKLDFNYEDKTLKCFLAAIKSSKFTILKGYSGTGKSSLPKLVAGALGAHCEVIPVQPNWKTKYDLMGFYNHFTNKFMPTAFTKTLIKANVNKEKIFFIVLDEMNLARVEYYFSELNSKMYDNEKLLELFESGIVMKEDDELAQVIKEGNKIEIPDNVFFIGTINEDDSVNSISDKIYDRAQVVDFITLPDSTSAGDINKLVPEKSYTRYEDFILKDKDNIKEHHLDFIKVINGELRARFNQNWAYRSFNQMKVFNHVFIESYGGADIDSLDLLLVSKLIPKIKFSYNIGNKLESLEKAITQKFKELKPNISDTELKKYDIFKQFDSIEKEFED